MPTDHYLIVLPDVYPTRAQADRSAREMKANLASSGLTHGRIRSLEIDVFTNAR